MPDSPANTDFFRKLSSDPETERMATKEELVSLLERGGAETRVSAAPHVEKNLAPQLEKSVAAQTERTADMKREKAELKAELAAGKKSKGESDSLYSTREMEEVFEPSERKRSILFGDDDENKPERAVPIPETISAGTAGQVDLVELAAILDQHRI